MKRRISRTLIATSLCVFCFSLIPSLLGFFSDVQGSQFKINASSLKITIEDFMVGVRTAQQTTDWYSRDEASQFDVQLIQDDIVEIQFVIRNQSGFDVEIQGDMELMFLNEQGEKDVLLLYPGNVDNSVIKANSSQQIDTGSLIGFGGDDSKTVTSSLGPRDGYQQSIITDTLTTISGEGDGFDSKRYTFKLHLSDAKMTLDELKDIVLNNKIGIGINAYVTAVNENISWDATAYAYGEIRTGIVLPSSLEMILFGDNPMYIAQNTEFTDPGAEAFDELGNPVAVHVEGFVDAAQYGSYTLVYTAEHAGIVMTKTRIVYVTDGIPPVITPKNKTPEKFVTDSLSLIDLVTLSDNVDSETQLKGNLVITTPQDYDSKTPGVYHICYNVKDSSGLDAAEQCIDLTIFAYKEVVPMYDTGMALTTHGRVYSWGYSGSGETGRNTTAVQHVPGEITTINTHNIIQIAGGQYYGMALSDAGRLFIWGYDGNGVQGNGSGHQNNLVPAELTGMGTIVQIDGSYYTPLVLNAEGSVYSWGYSTYSATGTGILVDVHTPTKLSFPNDAKIRYIDQGFYGGFAISEDNQLYGWGRNTYGALLLPSTGNVSTPTKLTDYLPAEIRVENIKEIATGGTHVYFLMTDGSLYSWGYNGYGQLGNATTSSAFNNTPALIRYFSDRNIKIEKIAAGQYYGVALDEYGTAYAWGQSAYGSYGKSGSYSTPQVITQSEVTHLTSIGAYYATTGLITSDGYLYMAGSNNLSDLGIGSSTTDKYEWVMTLHP